MGAHELNRPAYGTFQLNSGRPLAESTVGRACRRARWTHLQQRRKLAAVRYRPSDLSIALVLPRGQRLDEPLFRG
jgi:hypothetical protein